MADEVLRSLENQVASVCMGAPSRIVRLRAGVVEKLEATVGRRAIVVRVPGEILAALVAELERRVDGRPRAAVLVDPLVRELAGVALGEEHAALAEFLTAEALDEVPALAGRVLLARVAPVIAAEAGVAPAVVTALITARTGLGAFEAPGIDALRELGRVAARAHVAIVLVGGDATLLEGAPGFVLVDEVLTTRSGRVVAVDETPRLALPGLPAPVLAPIPVPVPAPPVEVKAAELTPEPIVAPPVPKAPVHVVPVKMRPPRAERSTLRKCAVVGLPFVFITSASVFALVHGEGWWHRAPGEVPPVPELGPQGKPVLKPVGLTAEVTTGQPVTGPPATAAKPQNARGAATPTGASKPTEAPVMRPGPDRGPRPGHYRPPTEPKKPEVSPEDLEREVEAARDVPTKLWVIDRAIAGGSREVVFAEIAQLYDRAPGTTPEGADLRKNLITRLGMLGNDPKVVSRLIEATQPSVSLAERLTAIEALGRSGPRAIPEDARAQLQRLADSDSDPLVKKAARQALGLRDQG